MIDPDSNTNFPKVGLGSSSALIVSIVASIVNYFHCASTEKKQLCHALAQYVNFLVQKKEGSGYDISAATYGNIIYKRPIFSFANFPESDFPKFIKEAIVSTVP